MKIYDCFLYNGEDKMLNFRLHELNEFVDKFIIVEGAYTFKGDLKPLKFEINKFEKFKDKIVYKVCNTQPLSNAWSNETNQRNFLKQGFKEIQVKTNDVIMLSDVDEIPDLTFLSNVKASNFWGVRTSYHNFYYYNTDCRKKTKWPGTVFISAGIFQDKANFNFDVIRNARHSFPLIGEPNDYTSGGWHFSYFGDVDYIINKIKSFSHQEYNSEKYTNAETIKQLIKNKKDLFFREDESEQFQDVKETYLPRCIDVLTNEVSVTNDNSITHSKIKEFFINTVKFEEIAKLDKKNIFTNTRDDGYHEFTPFWWTNLKCPYAYKYLHLDSLYPQFYFQPGGGHPDPIRSKELYDYMQQVYKQVFNKPFDSIFELGCGGGEITLQFKEHGIDYMCVEGTQAGKQRLVDVGIDSERIINSDLRLFKSINKKFDMVMCTEVAEHLEPTFSSKIVELCTDHANVVWFSAAKPNANCPHYHHPNELYIEAWDNLFAFFGFNKFTKLNGLHGRADRLYIKQ
jgi:beta-1,4-mannosyl-glycoprotein beta-1,4-N-acetylglucosaminyltransferase